MCSSLSQHTRPSGSGFAAPPPWGSGSAQSAGVVCAVESVLSASCSNRSWRVGGAAAGGVWLRLRSRACRAPAPASRPVRASCVRACVRACVAGDAGVGCIAPVGVWECVAHCDGARLDGRRGEEMRGVSRGASASRLSGDGGIGCGCRMGNAVGWAKGAALNGAWAVSAPFAERGRREPSRRCPPQWPSPPPPPSRGPCCWPQRWAARRPQPSSSSTETRRQRRGGCPPPRLRWRCPRRRRC